MNIFLYEGKSQTNMFFIYIIIIRVLNSLHETNKNMKQTRIRLWNHKGLWGQKVKRESEKLGIDGFLVKFLW